MHLHHEGLMIGVQYQLMICRGHIRASRGALQFFLWLMVLWQIDILVKFCTFVFILTAISKGQKWVWTLLLKPLQPFTGLFFDTLMKGQSMLIIEVLHQESIHRCILGCSS